MLRIGISGACGRMGKRIVEVASGRKDVKVTAALEEEGTGEVGKDIGLIAGARQLGVKVTSDLKKTFADIDCLIEFTLPGPTLEHVDACAESGMPIVIGTTGFGKDGIERIRKAATKIPVVFSPNMAVGVNVLFRIVQEAARILGHDFSVKIDETHHVHKKDSPSGTAKMIAEVISDATGGDAPIEAFRKGEVVGDHGIIFDGEYERLEIRHAAKSRDVFAAGAVKAALFLKGKKPGLYSMADVLGIT